MNCLKGIIIFLLLSSWVRAEIFFFGDSLTDTGNLPNIATLPPYLPGHFSNGFVWAEYFAAELGAFGDAEARASGGNNYAVGGAETAGDVNIETQLLVFQADLGLFGTLSSNDLCVLWIGGNDLLNGPGDEPALMIERIESFVSGLQLRNAQNFLFLNLPDLSQIPQELDNSNATLLRNRCIDFNTRLQAFVSSLDQTANTRAVVIDIFSMFEKLTTSPEAFGFVNVTEAAFNEDTREVVDDPNSYVSWDGLHPTTAAHRIIGRLAAHAYLDRSNFIPIFSSSTSDQLVASWIVPTSASSIQVEQSSTLSSNSWQSNGSPQSTAGGVFVIEKDVNLTKRFFRLREN